MSKRLPACVCVHWGEQVSFACGVERKVAAAASTSTSTSASLLASRRVAHLTHAAGFVLLGQFQFLQRRRVSWLRFLCAGRASE